MSDLFKFVKVPPPKKHFVTIDGRKIQVPLAKKLEIMRLGEEAYMLKPGKHHPDIVLRPVPKPKTRYTVLKKSDKGYTFEQDDIHWPNGVVEGGEAWLIEYE